MFKKLLAIFLKSAPGENRSPTRTEYVLTCDGKVMEIFDMTSEYTLTVKRNGTNVILKPNGDVYATYPSHCILKER